MKVAVSAGISVAIVAANGRDVRVELRVQEVHRVRGIEKRLREEAE